MLSHSIVGGSLALARSLVALADFTGKVVGVAGGDTNASKVRVAACAISSFSLALRRTASRASAFLTCAIALPAKMFCRALSCVGLLTQTISEYNSFV
ncbi:MAG: hypothetical protein A2V78_08860 [Betaproteobacteria bacterium RBG_16_64_18]|nr:MAG: hypothetical protein A2V78_08860 [Betaproteobacteria bacterium RBG_16_64_18]